MNTPTPWRPTDEMLPEGTVLGRHRVSGKLSEGAHALLYLGDHVETGAKVAIKVLRLAFAQDPEIGARFDREAQVMGRLAGCSHVVHVHDVGRTLDGRRYLVMEYVPGRELSVLLNNAKRRSEPMALERVCELARDLAAALRDIHGQGVVHRDLKPANIMIVRDLDGREQAKLVDFGVSADRGGSAEHVELTRAGAAIGTPEYMSPEQAVGLPAAPQMDIFAFGVLLFEMLTGERPPQKILRSGHVPGVESLRQGVPGALVELVAACLRLDPTQRPQDAIEILTRLRMAQEQLGRFSGPVKFSQGRPVRAAGAIGEDAYGAPPREIGSVEHTQVAPMHTPTQPILWSGVEHTQVAPPGERAFAGTGVDAQAGGLPVEIPAPLGDSASALHEPQNVPLEAAHEAPRRGWVVFGGLGLLLVAVVGAAAIFGGGNDRAPLEWPNRSAAGAEHGAVQAAAVVEAVDTAQLSHVAAAPAQPESSPAAVERPPEPEPSPAVAELPPEPEPDPGPESEPEPTPVAAVPPKPEAVEPNPSVPTRPTRGAQDPESSECQQTRTQARAASASLGWGAVLNHTQSTTCWPDKTARLRMRVEALAELGRYGDCVREGAGAQDAQVARIVALCGRRIDAG